jgi:hypothetical protein
MTPQKKLPLICGLSYQLVIVGCLAKVLNAKARHAAPLNSRKYLKTEVLYNFLKQPLQENTPLV